jgi:hypothetical protein
MVVVCLRIECTLAFHPPFLCFDALASRSIATEAYLFPRYTPMTDRHLRTDDINPPKAPLLNRKMPAGLVVSALTKLSVKTHERR